jgi:hypothetical protein
MMRLVIQYTTGDGYTWHAQNTVPVVYESAEAFLVDFEEIVKAKFASHDWRTSTFEFELGGQKFDYTDFIQEGEYYAPEIMTIDEWFKSEGVE